MTQDELGVLEELLDSLGRRGLAVSRLKFGSLELEFGSPQPITTLPVAYKPPVDIVHQADLGPDVPRKSYGVDSLWPNGVRPSFPKPGERNGGY